MLEIILPFNLVMSLLTFWLITQWYLMPKLLVMHRKEALTLLLLPHTIRHLGLNFLIVGVTAQVLDTRFSHPAAMGDLLTAGLAFLAILALRLEWKLAIPIVWVCNTVGLFDIVNAVTRGILFVPSGQFGAMQFIPALLVPMLLVSHVMIFKLLLKKRGN